MVTRQIAALFAELRMKTTGLTGDMARAQNELGTLATFVKAHPVAAVASLGVAIAGVGATAVKMAADVDAAMRRISGLLPTGAARLEQLRTELGAYARDTGRGMTELMQAASAIAEAGVSTPEELMKRLRAVTDVTDVVGGDLSQRVREADELMDIFSISADDLARRLAELWAVSRGRADYDEMVQVLTLGARAVGRTGADFDTLTRAMATMLSAGYKLRDIRSFLNKATLDEIRQLADQTPKSTTALNDLRDAANNVRESTERTAARMRETFHTQLIELGTDVLPPVNRELGEVLRLIQVMSGQHDVNVKLTLSGFEAGFAKLTEWNTRFEEFVRKHSPNSFMSRGLAAADQRALDAQIKAPAPANTGATLEETIRQQQAIVDRALAASKVGTVDTRQLVEGVLRRSPKADEAAAKAALAAAEKRARLARELAEKVAAFQEQLDAMSASLTRKNPFDDIGASFDKMARDAAELDTATKGATNFGDAVRRLRERALTLAQTDFSKPGKAFVASLADMRTALRDDPFASIDAQIAKLGRDLAETPMMPEDLTRARSEIQGLRDDLIAAESKKLLKIVDDQKIANSTTLIDDMGAALKEALKTLDKMPESAAKAAAIDYTKRMGEGSITAQKSIEAVAKQLEKIQKAASKTKFGLIDPSQLADLGQAARLMKLISETETADKTTRERAKALYGEIVGYINEQGQATKGLVTSDKLQTEEKKKQQELIKQILALLLGLDESQLAILGRTQKVSKSLSEQARFIMEAVAAAAQLAEAMGVVDDQTQQTIQAVSQLGIGIAEMLGGHEEQGAMNILAGLTGLITTLSGDSAADRERRKELAANTDAIRELSSHIGDLSKITITGSEFADVRAGLESLIAMTGDAGGFRRFGQKGSPLRGMDPKRYFESLGLDWSDVEQVARDTGITLNGTKQSYLDLLAALKELDMQIFLDTWTGQMAQFADELTLFDVESPLEQYTRFLKRLAGEKGAPELFGTLTDIDVQTEEGRQAMKEAIRKIFQGMADGTIDFATKYGNLTPAELQEALGRLFDFLEGVAQEYSRALDALTESFSVHGTSAAEQLAALGQLFGSEFTALSGVMDGINVGSAEDLATLRARLQAIYDALAEGEDGITEDERLVADAILRMLGGIDAAANEAAAKAARALGDTQDAFAILGTEPADRVGDLAELFAQRWDDFQGVLDNADLTTKDGIDALRTRLRGLLTIWQEGGISDEEREMIDALKLLLGALDEAGNAIRTFAEEMSDSFREIDLEARVMGEAAPQTLGKKLATFGIAGADLTSEAGQAKVLAQLQAMFATATDETKELIGSLVDDLRAVMEATAQASSAAAAAEQRLGGPTQVGQVQLTERQGVELTDLARVGNLIAREQLATLTRIADALVASGGGALIRPPMLGTFALGGGVGGGGDIIVSVRVNVTGVDPAKAYQVGQDIGAGIATSVESINRDLGGALRLDRRRRGSVELQ